MVHIVSFFYLKLINKYQQQDFFFVLKTKAESIASLSKRYKRAESCLLVDIIEVMAVLTSATISFFTKILER